jgi:hypothetical protein
VKIEVTEQDEKAYRRWLYSTDLKLSEAFALYRMELLEEPREQLKRCFRGETNSVRNEIIMKALKEQTDKILEMDKEDIKEYLERHYNG